MKITVRHETPRVATSQTQQDLDPETKKILKVNFEICFITVSNLI